MSVRLSPVDAAVNRSGEGRVHLVRSDGETATVQVRHGARLMPEVRAARVGVVGMCGGNAACGTCHVYLDREWADRLAAPDRREADMLDELESATGDSRLCCQITMTPELDEVVLTIAPHE